MSSPLTQLTLHPSPEHHEPVVKEEPRGLAQLPSCLSRLSAVPPATGHEALVDKDQMLQEKDKQIEELTRMLRQKQQQVETLRSQLEQGKRVAVATETPNGITEALLPHGFAPPQLNSMTMRVKEEAEDEKIMLTTAAATVSVAMETQQTTSPQQTAQRKVQMPCSQQTLLKLQQIQRLQVQPQANSF